ncbi:IclR family transcriptional regulator [Leucobacter allii]|uniref:IclR family transcriptional regulator n=1 Tax=Leucobacter allii TaxID=2932247 RepID=UPI001FCFF854|nr:IclR family transcriptional regulator [Leucobacter allii]UOR01528.1 IclR family transcriptional regulator [Leucobacter allii]
MTLEKQVLQQRPSYAIESVDNALRLLQIIRDENGIRMSDAAAELGVAASTAHRLLSMLVYRGFARQDENRCYVPGPSLGLRPTRISWTGALRNLARPHLEWLRDEVGETANLLVKDGDKVRFLLSVESRAALRVGDRRGAVLPAHETSGGIALLAESSDEELARLYLDASERAPRLARHDFVELLTRAAGARRVGYAVNQEYSERGVGAVGFALRAPSVAGAAAISVSCPVIRIDRLRSPEMIAACVEAQVRIEAEIRECLNGTD